MNTVTQLPAPVLTQAHRDAMAYIQALAITISMQGTYAVSIEYSGQVHEFSAHVLLFSEIEQRNFKALTTINVQLPGRCSWMGAPALQELQTMALILEGFLTPPTGDDAA
ncbi:hypothetical protein [Halomonas sp. GT]|uniref:hypothetical protein n=1 Tax=Halomonas sp. GT TaxID=1971364 RepID=UPI0012EBD401|nr:hypothetical protein [Halomonas sp. GT]